MKKQEMVYKNKERGAITLFVLLACLFFVFVIMGVYVSSLNKIQVQEQEIEQIRENYGKELKNVEEIYNELSKGMKVSLSQSPEAGTWTQEVTLTGKAEVREEGTTIVKYAFSKDVTDESDLTWETVDSETKIEKTTKITENGKYYFWAQDSEGNIKKSTELEISNIDNNDPTAGTIIAKTENKDGEEYTLNTWIDKSIYIEKVNGTDEESGHKQTTITILKNGLPVEEWTNIEGPVTIEESGTYTITVTTEDNAGNTATSESYIVKIDKVVPVLTLKHNDATGAEYESGTWTKDDLYGEITIDDATGKTVEKYQYSENGITWDDISEIPVVKELDYTTAFPMGEGNPEWISGPTNNNATYYFQVQEDGTLKPNNSGKNSSTANSYFEIDLTDYPDAELEITINATISSESNYDFGYATITEDATAPGYSSSTGQFIKVSGTTSTADHTTTITGGKKYYLHIGYRKDSSAAKNQDTFIINSITLKSGELAKGINFADYIKTENKVSFKFNEDIEKDIYIRAVYTEENDYSKYGDKISIKIDKQAPILESVEDVILSKTEAKLNVTVAENESGLKGYYISTEETEPTEESEWIEQILKEFTIEGLGTETIYYLWIIDNVGNISERQEVVIGKANYEIDGSMCTETLSEAITKASDGSIIKLLNDYTDTSTATINKNITFDIQGFTLTRDKAIVISSGKTVEITGTGKITTDTNSVNTITNNGTLTISNSITIENNSTSTDCAPIYSNSSSATTNINDNVKIIGYYRGIYNNYGIINVNGGYVEAIYANSSAYGIYNYYSSSKTYINSGEVRGYCGIYNSNSKAVTNVTGGKVVGTGSYGIYANGTTNIYGGRIEGKTYGVYGVATDKVTIGRQEDELSTTSPAILGETYGIYMKDTTYSFNFYNGVLISNTEETAYRGTINVRENHMVYTYLDYEIERRYCTILTPILENITIEATPTEYTNGNVTVRILYPQTEGLIKEYSENGTEWQATNYNNAQLIIGENKTIYARTMDESGIIIEETQIEVNNIDKEIPTVTVTPTDSQYVVTEEDGTVDITLTINAQDTGVSGLDKMQYAWAKVGDEPTYIDFTNEVTINKSNVGVGQYNLYLNVTDKAGNSAELTQMRYNVKLQEPVAQIGETKYLTIQDAIDVCSKDAVRIEQEYTTTFPMGEDKPEWISEPINNATYYFEAQEDGTLKPNNSGVNSVTANSYIEIDLTKVSKVEEIELILNATISSESNYDFGYATVTETTTAPAYNKSEGRFIYVSGTTTTAEHTTTLMGGKKYYLHIGYRKDSSGYSNKDTFIINSLSLKGNLPQEVIEQPTTIEMLKSTDEEFSTYEGQNIILDLKGHIIGSSNQETAICTNNAELQIIDTSTEKTAKLESLNATAIINNGSLTIGDNSSTIEANTPTIYGKKTGVINSNIFDFFDGKIQGMNPIQGKVTSTPEGYGPVSTEYNNGITTVQLGIVSGYEARIEWVYYTTVQEAIDATRTSVYDRNRDTVTILKNIQLVRTLTTSVAQNIILDLDGYTLINSPDIYIAIENNGKLEIIDSSEELTGEITVDANAESKTKSGIYNKIKGTIIISSGSINVTDRGRYSSSEGIYNQGTVNIKGGTINSNSERNNSYGIYNGSTGRVEVFGGTINAKNVNYGMCCGIYNYGAGVVIINGGEVNGERAEHGAYGIYNYGSGIITINGGSINGLGGNTYTTGHGIYNNDKGNVVVNGGKIDATGQDAYGIYNRTIGSIEIIEGNVSATGTNGGDGFGIYNKNGGTVTVTGGLVDGRSWNKNSYGIYNESTGTVKVNEGMVSTVNNSLDYSGFGIYNKSTGTIVVTAGTVSAVRNKSGATSYGIYNVAEGNIIVTGGMVVSSSSIKDCAKFAIFNNGIGSVTIGAKEELMTQEEPYIKVEYTGTEEETQNAKIGICNKQGILNFYSGKIEGKVSLLGTVTQVREGYEITKEENMTTEMVYLKEITEIVEIVQVEDVKYTSLQEAIDSIGEDEEKTIDVLIDFEIKEQIKFNKKVRLNLNGMEITNNYYKIENVGNLIIEDLTENKDGKLNCINTINAIENKENGNIEMIDGTINCSSDWEASWTCYAIYNNSTGTIRITGGTVSSSSKGIYNASTGTIELAGGLVSGTNGIANSSSGNVIVTGGMIISTSKAINNYGTGSVTITGGTINSESDDNYATYGIYNENEAAVIISGGTIYSETYAIYNNSTGTIEITGGAITGGQGIYNNSTGSVIVTGGTVSSTNSSKNSYGIYNKSTGSITIGTKEDGLVEQENPYIKGEYTGTSTDYVGYGIYNTAGTLYFYDGKIEGTTKAVYDIITEWEVGAELNYNEDETILTLTSELTDVAQIGETTYRSLQEAIDAAGSEQTTIKLLRNVTYMNQDSVITVPNTKNIILDLSGYKITSTIPEKVIQNEGILEIIDSSEEQTGTILTTEETTVSNIAGAKLTITGGTIENRTKQAIYNEGELLIGGGTVSGNGSSGYSYGIYNTNTGTIEVTGGTVSSNTNYESSISYGIYNSENGIVTITGGTVSSNVYGYWSNYCNSYGIYNANIGTIIVDGGTVSGICSCESGDRSKYSNSYGIYNADTGIVTITEGTISSSSGSNYSDSYGIYNLSTGTITIQGGTVSSGYGSRDNYGIYNRTGIIIIGTKGDGLIAQEAPYIDGGYGIRNVRGTLNFYDGKIEGSTSAIYGDITEIEEKTELLITNNNKTVQLEQKNTKAVSANGTEYDSIQKAVQASGTTESIIKLLRDVNPSITIIIEENQNITIDLNGYTLNNYQKIINNGTLKIIDTSEAQKGVINSVSETVINNEGTMEIQSGYILNSVYGIKNAGTLTISGGNISNNTYGIYNSNGGTLNVTDGTITLNTYGIYNYKYDGNVITNIIGGTITSNEYGIYNYGGATNITSTGITSNTYGIYNAGGTTNIKEGTQITSTTGVYNSSGTVNIGETGTMNSESPIITGEEYGLVNATSAIVYMYDGQIKGKEGATQGYISYTETGYAVATKTDGEYMVDYLALSGTVSTVAEVNGISFSNLQSAINSVTGTDAVTIKLTNGINTSQSYTIAEEQNIILDMNGKTITSDQEVTITNNGTLTIIDTSGSNVAKITNTVGTAIINNGTLSLGENDGTVNQDLINIEGTTYGIQNSGTLNFYDGTINGASAVNGTITTRADGYVIRTTTVDSKERYYLSA